MYNRYIPNGTAYTRIPMEDGAEVRPEPERAGQGPPESRPAGEGTEPGSGRRPQTEPSIPGLGALSGLLGQNPLGQLLKKTPDGGLNGILKALHLEELDTGDILLLLILLFLFLEGDNIEVVITLGLILLLGLGDEKKSQLT